MPLATDDALTRWYSPKRAGGSVAAISLRLRETTHAGVPSEEDTVPGSAAQGDKRRDLRMLWVDGVGGYLVTLAEEITLGQPALGGAEAPDLPILADLSRRHARLARSGGRYVLTPYGEASVNGRPIDGPTVVEDGALIGLGAVRARFHRPHALSASALLVMESGHRTVPAADAVLLMAESCVLGPKPHSHIRCSKAQGEAILFRGADGLVCRGQGPLLAGGETAEGPITLRSGERIEGQDFAFCVEEVDEA